MSEYALYLHEEIMLLSLRDREGTLEPNISYREAIAGAILADLILRKFIEVDNSKRNHPIRLLKSGPIGNDLLDECINKIKESKRRKSLKDWVLRFRNVSKLKHRIATDLCHKGILSESQDKVMLFFTRRIYPEVNSEPEQKIIERLRDAIFTETENVDSETIILISLAYHSKLLKRIFDKTALKKRKDRIKQITSGDVVGKATKEAIAAIQAAMVTAVIVPSVAATSASR